MKQVDLSKYSNKCYKAGAFIKRVFWYITSLIFFNSGFPYPSNLKVFLLKIFGAGVGSNVNIKHEINIKYPWFLKIGNNVWLGQGVWIDNLAFVEIGDNVCISQGVVIFTGNHNYKRESFDLITKAVVIEDGVWLGGKSIICPGVIIKDHAVIMAGSVVTHDTEAYKIYQGNPAKAIHQRIIE